MRAETFQVMESRLTFSDLSSIEKAVFCVTKCLFKLGLCFSLQPKCVAGVARILYMELFWPFCCLHGDD